MSFQEYHYTDNIFNGVTLFNASAKKVAEYKYFYSGTVKPVKFQYLEYDTAGQLNLIIEQAYEYNTAGQQIMANVTHFNGFAAYYISTAYLGRNISVSKTYTLPANTLKEEVIYEYDNKPNPYYQQHFNDAGGARFNSANNIVKMKSLSSVSGNDDYMCEYLYNDDGLPVKKFRKLTDGSKKLQQTFEYQ